MTGDSAFDIQSALERQPLPKGYRWVSFAFDGRHVIGILARGLEDPAYEQVVCADVSHAAKPVSAAVQKLG